MSTPVPAASLPARPLKWALLAMLFVLGLWYLGHELLESLTRDRNGESPLRTGVLLMHLVLTLPLLLLPAVQFSRRIRQRHRRLHRTVGQVYLVGAIGAATAAIPLAITQEGEGRGVPTVIFAVLWLAFSAAAWYCARTGAFARHEQFVVRSYCIAVAFVVIRVLRDFQEQLFPFISIVEVRDVTRDWLCFVVPLLLVETWYSWWPAVRPPRRP